MLRRILVGLGGTPYTSVAIRRGVELAQRHNAHLTGVTVVDAARLAHVGAAPVGASGAIQELRRHRFEVTEQRIDEAIAEFEAACTRSGVQYTVDQEKGDEFVLMTELSHHHDLMIFGLRSLFDYGLGIDPPDALGRLIGYGVRPILAVSEHYREIRRVLLTYSGSNESAKTIKGFLQGDLWPDMHLKLMVCDRSKQNSRRLLDDMAAYCEAYGHRPETLLAIGSPQHEILAEAEDWGADLIVLGNSRRSYLSGAIFGETALSVIKKSDRPLFLSH